MHVVGFLALAVALAPPLTDAPLLSLQFSSETTSAQ